MTQASQPSRAEAQRIDADGGERGALALLGSLLLLVILVLLRHITGS